MKKISGDTAQGRGADMEKKELGIYVHIPFCARKCSYCDFLSFPAGVSVQEDYFRKLREEIASFPLSGDYEAVSVYFGGGTPSLPDPEQIAKTLDVIRESFALSRDAEITIECNPGTLDRHRLAAYRSAGFNRLSIGLQSADDTLLGTLGRIHTFETFRREYLQAREEGFDNISIDLMYGLPKQTLSSWKDTLEKTVELDPEHVSAYSLIIEEGTPFWDRYHEDDEEKRRGARPLFLPDEETEGKMLALLKSSLSDIGICRYEISSYAKPGYESRHNTGYWLRREYAGFGLGASGQIRKFRYRNQTRLEDYLNTAGPDGSVEERTTLSREDEISETMILGLRMIRGVDLTRFEERFHVRAEDLFKEVIDRFTKAGLLDITNQHLHLTDRGFDVSNLVMCEFL